MPTPSGEKSVADAISIGMPFVKASGIAHVIYHTGGCGQWGGRCTCGVDAACRHLALEFDEVLEVYGKPT